MSPGLERESRAGLAIKRVILSACLIILIAWVIVTVTLYVRVDHETIWCESGTVFKLFSAIAIPCATLAAFVLSNSPRLRAPIVAAAGQVPKAWGAIMDSGTTKYFDPDYYTISHGNYVRKTNLNIQVDKYGLPIVNEEVPLTSFNMYIYKRYHGPVLRLADSFKSLTRASMRNHPLVNTVYGIDEKIDIFHKILSTQMCVSVIGQECMVVKPYTSGHLLIHRTNYLHFIRDHIDNSGWLSSMRALANSALYEMGKAPGLIWLLSSLLSDNFDPLETFANAHVYKPIRRELWALCKLYPTNISTIYRAFVSFVMDKDSEIAFPFIERAYVTATIRTEVIRRMPAIIVSTHNYLEETADIDMRSFYEFIAGVGNPKAIAPFTQVIMSLDYDPVISRLTKTVQVMLRDPAKMQELFERNITSSESVGVHAMSANDMDVEKIVIKRMLPYLTKAPFAEALRAHNSEVSKKTSMSTAFKNELTSLVPLTVATKSISETISSINYPTGIVVRAIKRQPRMISNAIIQRARITADTTLKRKTDKKSEATNHYEKASKKRRNHLESFARKVMGMNKKEHAALSDSTAVLKAKVNAVNGMLDNDTTPAKEKGLFSSVAKAVSVFKKSQKQLESAEKELADEEASNNIVVPVNRPVESRLLTAAGSMKTAAMASMPEKDDSDAKDESLIVLDLITDLKETAKRKQIAVDASMQKLTAILARSNEARNSISTNQLMLALPAPVSQSPVTQSPSTSPVTQSPSTSVVPSTALVARGGSGEIVPSSNLVGFVQSLRQGLELRGNELRGIDSKRTETQAKYETAVREYNAITGELNARENAVRVISNWIAESMTKDVVNLTDIENLQKQKMEALDKARALATRLRDITSTLSSIKSTADDLYAQASECFKNIAIEYNSALDSIQIDYSRQSAMAKAIDQAIVSTEMVAPTNIAIPVEPTNTVDNTIATEPTNAMGSIFQFSGEDPMSVPAKEPSAMGSIFQFSDDAMVVPTDTSDSSTSTNKSIFQFNASDTITPASKAPSVGKSIFQFNSTPDTITPASSVPSSSVPNASVSDLSKEASDITNKLKQQARWKSATKAAMFYKRMELIDAQAKQTAYETKVAELEAKLAAAGDSKAKEIASIQTELSNAKSTANDEIARLKSQIESASVTGTADATEIASLREQLAKKERESAQSIAAIEQKLRETSAVSKLTAVITNRKNAKELADKYKEIALLKQSKEMLSLQMEDLEAKVRATEDSKNQNEATLRANQEQLNKELNAKLILQRALLAKQRQLAATHSKNLDEWKQKLAKQEQENAATQARLHSETKALTSKFNDEKTDLEKRLSSTETKKSKLRSQLKKSNATNAQLTEQLQAATVALEQATETHSKVSQEAEASIKKLQTDKAAIEASGKAAIEHGKNQYEQQIQGLQQQLAMLPEPPAQMVEALKNLKREKEAEAKKASDQLSAQLKEFSQRETAAARQLAEMTSERDRIAKEAEALKKSKEKTDATIQSLAQSTASTEELARTLTDQKRELEESFKVAQQTQSEKHAKAQEEAAQTIKDLQSAKVDLMREAEEKNKEFEMERAKVFSLQTQLAESNARLSKSDARLAESKLQMSDYQSRLSNAESQMSSLDAKLIESDARLTSSETRLVETEALLHDSQSRLADSDARLASSEARLNDTQSRLADSENAARKTIDQLKQESERAVAQMRSDLDAKVSDLEEMTVKNSKYLSEIETLNTGLSQGAVRIGDLESNIQALNEELKGLRDGSGRKEAEQIKQASEMESLRAEIEKYKKEAASAKGDADRLRKDIDEIGDSVTTKDAEIAKANQALRDLQAAMAREMAAASMKAREQEQEAAERAKEAAAREREAIANEQARKELEAAQKKANKKALARKGVVVAPMLPQKIVVNDSAFDITPELLTQLTDAIPKLRENSDPHDIAKKPLLEILKHMIRSAPKVSPDGTVSSVSITSAAAALVVAFGVKDQIQAQYFESASKLKIDDDENIQTIYPELHIIRQFINAINGLNEAQLSRYATPDILGVIENPTSEAIMQRIRDLQKLMIKTPAQVAEKRSKASDNSVRRLDEIDIIVKKLTDGLANLRATSHGINVADSDIMNASRVVTNATNLAKTVDRNSNTNIKKVRNELATLSKEFDAYVVKINDRKNKLFPQMEPAAPEPKEEPAAPEPVIEEVPAEPEPPSKDPIIQEALKIVSTAGDIWNHFNSEIAKAKTSINDPMDMDLIDGDVVTINMDNARLGIAPSSATALFDKINDPKTTFEEANSYLELMTAIPSKLSAQLSKDIDSLNESYKTSIAKIPRQ